MSLNINEVRIGDVFSESSHYSYLGKQLKGHQFRHLESGETVTLDEKYVTQLLQTADQYQSEVKVGKEDKKDGTPGIRTIWENIHSSQVFTVCFKKQDKALSIKKINELKKAQIDTALEKINKAKISKKGVADVAKLALEDIQNNPILPFEQGESRKLRGYKIQFSSRDGKYDCIDMDLSKPDNIRPVNINTIEYLVYNGVKYTIE